jgi:hypothetical protein
MVSAFERSKAETSTIIPTIHAFQEASGLRPRRQHAITGDLRVQPLYHLSLEGNVLMGHPVEHGLNAHLGLAGGEDCLLAE